MRSLPTNSLNIWKIPARIVIPDRRLKSLKDQSALCIPQCPKTTVSFPLLIMLPSIVPRIQQKVMEHQIVANSPKLTAMLGHPAGPFTVHFWAPTIKWAISLANVADMRRSPETISVAQQTAVTGTGLIWSRYSMVITPKNWNLFAVNVFMAGTGLVQFYRKFTYDPSTKTEETADRKSVV